MWYMKIIWIYFFLLLGTGKKDEAEKPLDIRYQTSNGRALLNSTKENIKLNLPVVTQDEERKLTSIFIFTLLCGASKSFMKGLKAFIKPSEAPQRSVKIKMKVNFYFNTTSLKAFINPFEAPQRSVKVKM